MGMGFAGIIDSWPGIIPENSLPLAQVKWPLSLRCSIAATFEGRGNYQWDGQSISSWVLQWGASPRLGPLKGGTLELKSVMWLNQ